MNGDIISELEELGQVRDVAFIGEEGAEDCSCLVIRVRDYDEWKKKEVSVRGGKV